MIVSGKQRNVLPVSARPETITQAVTWTTRNNQYIAAGLCFACAAQAAWGTSIGFTKVRPPCPACAPVVAGFPGKAAGGWKTLPRTAGGQSAMGDTPQQSQRRSPRGAIAIASESGRHDSAEVAA